ncbi:MAG: hypothetical protein ABGX27_08035 [Desulfurobacteriaceae bacterium]
MSENTIYGIICTIIAIALPLSFAIIAWKSTLSEKKDGSGSEPRGE